MNIRVVRYLNVLLVLAILSFNKLGLLPYVAVMHFSLEVLNRKTVYLKERARIFNIIFWSYELVLLERLRSFQLSADFEWVLNSIEHLLFAIVICIKIYFYLEAFFLKKSMPKFRNAVYAFILFSALGVLNEYFQNFINNRSLFVLIADSLKDISMNCIGAAIFFLTAFTKLVITNRKLNMYF